ncbi:hypothetical protein NHX12_018179 [Muraenolepis orangiensis]|uniref:P-type domain-containing protein n=1 Tax=Muraenolepis orangiensis TaxID=630683 RepID=A0A9Q0IYD5_9TELE|nr:hypothetical protein NHX12_018179 [Muraenolepis orangiensis]
MVSYKRLDPENVLFSKETVGDPTEERPPVPRKPWCSSVTTTTALLVLGSVLLLLCAGWLLATMFWLHHHPHFGGGKQQQASHRPPPPATYSGRRRNEQMGPSASAPDPVACGIIPQPRRFDCYPERGAVVTRGMCEARGCCFIPASSSSSSPSSGSRRSGIPWCFYPTGFGSYSLVWANDTALGKEGRLVRDKKSYYPGDVLALHLETRHETDMRLRVRITDPSNSRYEVPIAVPEATRKANHPAYSVELCKDPFGLVVKRLSTGMVLLNTTVAPLFYADQFLQFSSSLPGPFLYGLGEHRAAFLHDVHWTTLTMWARDVPPVENTNLYGAHPFYLALEEPGGEAHGFFLLNSNAMDVVLQPAPAVTWRTIGGILDFYVFLGPDPTSVISQYLEVVGTNTMTSRVLHFYPEASLVEVESASFYGVKVEPRQVLVDQSRDAAFAYNADEVG